MLVVSHCAHVDGYEVSQIEVTYIEIASIKNGEELKEYVMDQIKIIKKVTIDAYIKKITPEYEKFIIKNGKSSAHMFFLGDQNMSRDSVEILLEYMDKNEVQKLNKEAV